MTKISKINLKTILSAAPCLFISAQSTWTWSPPDSEIDEINVSRDLPESEAVDPDTCLYIELGSCYLNDRVAVHEALRECKKIGGV